MQGKWRSCSEVDLMDWQLRGRRKVASQLKELVTSKHDIVWTCVGVKNPELVSDMIPPTTSCTVCSLILDPLQFILHCLVSTGA